MIGFVFGLFLGFSLGVILMAVISVGKTEEEEVINKMSLDELIMELKQQQEELWDEN